MSLLLESHQFCRRMSDGGRPPEVSVQTRASNRPGAAVAQKAVVVSNSGKRRSPQGRQVSVEKVNESEPSEDASRGKEVLSKLRALETCRISLRDILFTAQTTAGVKAARARPGRSWGTREI